jgi:hypothetical protein
MPQAITCGEAVVYQRCHEDDGHDKGFVDKQLTVMGFALC